MDVATASLSTLLPKLAQLLKYNLQAGAREGIEFLHKELERTQAALHELGKVPLEEQSKLERNWAHHMRGVSYDMEDIVDTFMVRVQGARPPPSKTSAKNLIDKMRSMVTKAKARHKVGKEIQGIKERVREVADRLNRFNLDAIITKAKRTPVDPRITALHKVTQPVGIDEAKEEVIAWLTKGCNADQQERIVVSIAGFGGLGKTTLAKAVHDEIKGQFLCTAFVSVSRNPDTLKLLKDMLHALDKKKFEDIHSTKLDVTHLIDLIKEFLENKRYLIVIDDIWDKEPWDKAIGLSLIENNMQSRIITTTRNIDVAEHVGGFYRLKPLSDKSSEMLFYGRVFGSQDKCPRKFSEVSKRILKKCGGVPLAIMTTSSLLANKSENIKVWEDLCASIGSGLGKNNPGMDDMRKILLLSYYDLPSHLKTCLLYLSIFPEDYEISKDRLIWRWIAEGFVKQVQHAAGDQISFLEVGESYFNELLNRSLIQPGDIYNAEGTPKACRLHDTVLDLIISLSVEECFITTTVLSDGIESKVRWLSLHNTTAWPTMKMQKLRSLTIFKSHAVVIDPIPYLPSYRLLRVLDLQGCRFKDLASIGHLGSLSHLRYLGLSSHAGLYVGYISSGDELPVEIGKLRFLQTLDLSHIMVEELNNAIITGLGQLMCLRGSNVMRTKLPDGLKNLTCLEVLESAIVSSECVAEELGHLTKLRILEVSIVPCELVGDDELEAAVAKALVESIGKLAKIESLSIDIRSHDVLGANLDGPIEDPLENLRQLKIGKAMVMPTWIESALLPGLCYLDIEVMYERREDIQVHGSLPCLRHLRFTVWSNTEEEALERCAVGPDAFPRVVSCVFDVVGVVPCTFPRGSMPMLEDLEFWIDMSLFCSAGDGGFTLDDLGLGHLPSLRRVTVVGLYGEHKSVREKLEHEAAVHANHPLRINIHN